MTFRKVLVASLGVCLALLPLASASIAAEGKRSERFLTGPQEGEALDLALSYLHANYKSLNLTPADLSELKVTDQYVTAHNGTTHIFFAQRQNGIPVFNGLIGVHVASDGSIIHLTNGFVSDLASKITTTSAQLSAEEAIMKAADFLGMSAVARSPRLLESNGSRDSAASYDGAGISRQDIRVNQTYVSKDGAIRLAWQIEVDQIGSSDWLDMMIDAENGELLGEHNRTQHVDDEANVGGVPQDVYFVFPLPGEHPEDIGQVDVVGPADPVASPHGWHDTDGIAGGEFTNTRGRNVDAYDDINNNNLPDNTYVSGGAMSPLDFDYPFNPALGPTGGTNREAAIVNLFYWNNIMHDLLHHYGFDAASGNFEGADPVNAEAQDGSGTNNANFSTPSEGNRPRMQMFVWTAPPAFVVNSPGGIAGSYAAGGASFGAALAGQTGNLALVDDGDDEGGTGSTTDACQALPAGSMDGLIALIDRGSCEFGLKVLNAENAGAIAAVVVNNQGDGVLTMGPGVNGGSVTIAAMFIGQGTGDIVKAELREAGEGGGVNVTLSSAVDPDRDSDFDAGVISHEYGHGISIRLTGGPTNVFCLSGDEQAGEGWSDFWSLVLFADETDTRETTRGVGNYLLFEDETGGGIRNFPYSTDMKVNPQTYADINGTNVPHGVGEIWALMLWEMYWNLVDKHGFDTDLYTGTGGNNLTIQLMIDGLKLQGCTPTFVAARDAILTADANDNGGANACEIWRAFAKRGVGTGASAGTTAVGDETEDFNVPVECLVDIFDDGFESGDTTAWASTVP